jgi:hypothetical protein
MVIPCVNELADLRIEVVFGGNIDASQALPWEEADPLFDWIHPRTMHGCEVPANARMVGEPGVDFFAMMRADLVAYARDHTDVLGTLRVPCVPQGEQVPLSLPVITRPLDRASTGVKGGTEMAGTSALSLVRVPGGTVLRLGWQGGGATRSRRQGGLLVHRHHQCIRTPRPCVEGHQFRHGGREGGIPRRFGRQPDMLPPGCQVRRGQHPAHRGGGARFNAPLRDERARQVGTLPRGETAAQ